VGVEKWARPIFINRISVQHLFIPSNKKRYQMPAGISLEFLLTKYIFDEDSTILRNKHNSSFSSNLLVYDKNTIIKSIKKSLFPFLKRK
jgi:hypothetical protein